MPEDRYGLLFRDARFLPCWPGEPPPDVISLALTASLANAQKFYFYTIGEPTSAWRRSGSSRAFRLTSGVNGTM
jgi:hypothetical protein